ncbi:uncharacterized protein EKO05_0006100 [Ascochyta rabiei]|uniref:Uncharacterized protein n=1 Tax=Didymella rabiei TaxID=5454 RepID=A0A163MK24_DIDRA|nr:uncharacterized protein EKO05_0006100 [Ascochyta rabiei]KZM28785.1 hypothetical protein ST47_g70 [Ascochyta rabiei]UPX15659.1 hypothetical protein EKO05_0006100 [Ascochyta rabiei]
MLTVTKPSRITTSAPTNNARLEFENYERSVRSQLSGTEYSPGPQALGFLHHLEIRRSDQMTPYTQVLGEVLEVPHIAIRTYLFLDPDFLSGESGLSCPLILSPASGQRKQVHLEQPQNYVQLYLLELHGFLVTGLPVFILEKRGDCAEKASLAILG